MLPLPFFPSQKFESINFTNSEKFQIHLFFQNYSKKGLGGSRWRNILGGWLFFTGGSGVWGGWRYNLGWLGWLGIFWGWMGVGGEVVGIYCRWVRVGGYFLWVGGGVWGGWRYILYWWGWLDIFYGCLAVGGGILCLGGSGWTISIVGVGGDGWTFSVDGWGWVGMVGGLFWVCGGGWTFFMAECG